MKRVFATILTLAVLLTLTSCYDTFPKGGVHRACASFAVPGIFSGIRTYWDVIEKDAQGRELFEIVEDNAFMDEAYEMVYVICQKYDDDYVYYYEDSAHMLKSSKTDSIEALKERNDWGKPLDESKMSRRTATFTFDMTIIVDDGLDNDKVKDVLSQELGTTSDAIVHIYFDDMDPNGLVLYDVLIKDPVTEQKTYYFAIFDSAYHVSILTVEDINEYDKGLREFKQANGWEYGF